MRSVLQKQRLMADLETARALFQFDLEGLDTPAIERLFPLGWSTRYSISKNRMIQNYLVVQNYYVCAVMGSGFKSEDEPPYRFIALCRMENANETVGRLRTKMRETMAYGTFGYTIIDVVDIHSYVLGKLSEIGKAGELISLKKASEDIWPHLVNTQESKNRANAMRALIQTWMRTKAKDSKTKTVMPVEPVFWPIEHAEARDQGGSRLDQADLTVIGFLYGLFRHGVKYSDFAASVKVTRSVK